MKALLRFVLTPQNLAGLLIVLAFFAIAIAAPSLAPYDDDPGLPPYFSRVGRVTDQQPHPPSPEAPLGTLGGQYSVYYTLVWGTRSALRFGIIVAAATAALGVVVGASSGYVGGWLQRITIPVTDAFLAVPAIAGYWVVRYSLFPADPNVLTTAVQALVVHLGLDPLMVALILFSWMPYARITNTSTMRLRQIEYVQAARSLGAGGFRIVFRHIVPNLLAPIVVLATRDVGGTVMLAAAFSFIGIGGELPWGELLAIGRDWIIGPGGSLTAYWWIYAPVTAALLLFGIGWNVLGDGVNDLVAGRRAATVVDVARRKWFPVAAGLVLGLAFGLTFSWVIDPVRLVDAAPGQLSLEYRQDYLRAAADSFSLNMDVGTALQRFEALGSSALETLRQIRQPQSSVPDPFTEGFAFVIDSLGATGEAPGLSPPPRARLTTWGTAGLVVATLAGGLATTVLRRRRLRRTSAPPVVVNPLDATPKASVPPTTAAPEAPSDDSSLGVFQADFAPGDGRTEPAFVIENTTGEFLGECGVASSDTTPSAAASPAPALEVWLFDKVGLQTVTAFLLPPGAVPDGELQHRLARRGQVLQAQSGLQFHLESRSLRLQATINQIEIAPRSPGYPAGIRRAALHLRVQRRPAGLH